MDMTLHPTGDGGSVCPVTGLPVHQRPEWTDRRLGEAFQLTIYVIGDRILLNRPTGYATLDDVDASFELIDAVVADHIDSVRGYVHISDYAGMRGISHDARRRYVRYIETNPHLLGVIYFGVSPLFRIMIKLASRLTRAQTNVQIVDDYPAALKAAMLLIDGKSDPARSVGRAGPAPPAVISEHREQGHTIQRCDRWQLNLDDYQLTVEVIDRRIYHAISMGVMRAHHVEPVDRLRESVRRMLGLEKGFAVIMTGTTGSQRSDRQVRRQYMASLKRWHERFPLGLYVFYEANWFVRTAAALATPFMPFRVRVARSRAEALALTGRLAAAEPLKPVADTEHPEHVVHQLLQFIGDIDWGTEAAPTTNPVDPGHPFHPVFDAILLVKSEMDAACAARRRMADNRLALRQRFEDMLKYAPDIHFQLDLRRGTYTYISDAVEGLLGYSPDELRRMGYEGVRSLIHPDDLSRFLLLNARTPRETPPAAGRDESRYRIRDREHRYHWFSDRRTVVRGADGQPAFVIGSIRDITDKKIAEDERQAAHARLTAVMDGIGAHIYVADIETFEILFMNRAMRQAFGDFRPGERCFERFRGADKVCKDCVNHRLRDDKGAPAGIYTWEGPHPVQGRWYLNHDQAIRWVDGRIARLQIATDISRIKSLESERRESAERLRHTRKLEAVSTMAGGVAHNFNNLLMVVLGNLELLRGEVADCPDLIRKIEAAEKSASKAADLSTLMLTYVGQTRISPETVDLNVTLAKMVDVLETTVAERARLELKAAETDAWISADVSKVYQVITNLVTNAVEACGDTPLTIDLSVGVQYCDAAQLARLSPGEELAVGRYVWLRVSDNGRGMNQDTLEKVFDPFFTTKFAGRGLGMAAVMGIMRAHRGGVRIDSRPGTGTAVTVYFPESRRAVPAASTKPPADAADYRGLVLLVDDEPLVLELGTQMLEMMGFDVLTAADGVDALSVSVRHRDQICLALLDIHMPRMGGRETLDQLRAMGATFPVLVTSGFTEAQARERLGDSRADGYINKPFRIDQLKAKIDAILRSDENGAKGDPGHL